VVTDLCASALTDTYRHCWQALISLLSDEENLTQDIVCDVGMPVFHRGVGYNCRVLLLNRSLYLLFALFVSLCSLLPLGLSVCLSLSLSLSLSLYLSFSLSFSFSLSIFLSLFLSLSLSIYLSLSDLSL